MRSLAKASSLTYLFTSYALLVPKQVKAAVAALRNVDDLNWPSSFEQHRQKSKDLDLLDWLRAMFGFQVFLTYIRFRSCILLCSDTLLQLKCFLHFFLTRETVLETKENT